MTDAPKDGDVYVHVRWGSGTDTDLMAALDSLVIRFIEGHVPYAAFPTDAEELAAHAVTWLRRKYAGA